MSESDPILCVNRVSCSKNFFASSVAAAFFAEACEEGPPPALAETTDESAEGSKASRVRI